MAAIESSWLTAVYRRLPAPVRRFVYRRVARRKLVGLGFIRKMEAL